MRLPLDRHSDIPLYRQIEGFLRQGILSGSFAPETRLPATRTLARDLGLNRLTVETAYAELQADGLIYTRSGSGTYVLPRFQPAPVAHTSSDLAWPRWHHAEMRSVSAPTPDELLAAARQPHPLSLANGTGDPHLFPVKDFHKIMQTVIRRDGIAALEYGDPRGYAPLRRTIAHVLTSQGMAVHPDQILITSGSQQGLALVSQLLLKPGDEVLVETPTYAGALDLFRALNLSIVSVPLDAQGLQIERLEQRLQQRLIKLIYTMPTFQNPTGSCLSTPRRRQLLALADRYNVPILEDDFVGDLRYEGRAQPALKALDPGGHVIYASTFSKMLMPGLRVGFLVATGPIYDRLVNFKRASDLATSNLIQRAVEAYVTIGRYQAHLRRSCQIYRQRRDAMLTSIKRQLPASVQFNPPHGGLFVWLRLPAGLSSSELLPLACEAGVAFAPGRDFFPADSVEDNGLRLNFATQQPADIEEAIKRLGIALRRLR
ncbi:2-aminoadipate transaminase [Thermoflexales bacterium]|nr:2-aminoadipate transaminase [Thermoflexales bacterium]